MGVNEILNNVYNGELATISKYECQIREIKDPHIQAMLERIILDEKIHAGIFKEFMHKFNSNN